MHFEGIFFESFLENKQKNSPAGFGKAWNITLKKETDRKANILLKKDIASTLVY